MADLKTIPPALNATATGRLQDAVPVTGLRTLDFPQQSLQGLPEPCDRLRRGAKLVLHLVRSSCPVHTQRCFISRALAIKRDDRRHEGLSVFILFFILIASAASCSRGLGKGTRQANSVLPALPSTGKLLNKKMLLKHVPSALCSILWLKWKPETLHCHRK